jgi:hypothetical protein
MRIASRLGKLVVFALFILSVSVLSAPPLRAQTDPQPAVAWPAQVDDAPDEDRAVVPDGIDYPSTLGDDMLASDADPSLVNPARALGTDTLIYPLGLTVVDPSASKAPTRTTSPIRTRARPSSSSPPTTPATSLVPATPSATTAPAPACPMVAASSRSSTTSRRRV